jgi:hypothetical protein
MKNRPYVKACKCVGTSSQGNYAMTNKKGRRVETTFYFNTLHCDVCMKPWKRLSKKALAARKEA